MSCFFYLLECDDPEGQAADGGEITDELVVTMGTVTKAVVKVGDAGTRSDAGTASEEAERRQVGEAKVTETVQTETIATTKPVTVISVWTQIRSHGGLL